MRKILCALAVLACAAVVVPDADAFHRRRGRVVVKVGGFGGTRVAVANRGFLGRRTIVNVDSFGVVQPAAFVRSRVLVQPTFVQPAFFGGGVTLQSGGCGALFIR